jgi:hypothetical protein
LRLLHLADLHLGFRQYQRLTPGGINQREADVARTFETAIDRAIETAPEVIVIAGDVFHSVRPSNPAILHSFIHFARLMQALPKTRVVMVAGNHDLPRSSETGCILQLFSRLGMDVVDREAQRISIPEYDLSVLAVPHSTAPTLDPDPAFSHNVLVMHAEIEGMIPMAGATAERASLIIPQSAIDTSKWSYVALGHYHVYRKLDENMFYSGSTDYTSTNHWGELHEERVSGIDGKGFVEWHFETRTALFRPLPRSRNFVDLPAISAEGLSVPEIDDQIRQHVDGFPGGIDDRVVRLRLHDMPRHVARELDQRAIREYKKRALNFFLDIRRPENVQRSASGAPGRRPTLDEVLQSWLATRLIPVEVDRARLIDLGVRYLAEADALGVPAAAAAPEV